MRKSVTLLQEIWNPDPAITDTLKEYICYTKTRADGYGGTMLLTMDTRLKAINELKKINSDSSIIKINIGGDRNLWISSLYIPKKTRKNLLNTISEIQRIVPPKEWPYIMLVGDWNIDIKDKEDKVTQTFFILCKKKWGLS